MHRARYSTSSNSIASASFIISSCSTRRVSDLPGIIGWSPSPFPSTSPWNLKAFADVADKIFVMAYDEHSNDGPPGPIASQQWWASSVAAAVRQIPHDKVIVTIGNYAYDWHDGGGDPENVEEAWGDAADNDAPPQWDRVREQHLRLSGRKRSSAHGLDARCGERVQSTHIT